MWHSGICKAGVGVLAFLGMMLLWDVSPYPVYLCLVYVPSEIVLVVLDSFLILPMLHVCPYCFSPAK